MRIIRNGMMFATPRYDYKPPDPSKWTGFGSHIEIENDFVTDNRPKIHLTVKLAPRKVGPGSWNFSDRNVDDVKDGYVSCEPFQVIETSFVIIVLLFLYLRTRRDGARWAPWTGGCRRCRC